MDAIVDSPTPRSEISSGKPVESITDGDGNPYPVHQGNLDTPLSPVRIKTILVED